MTKGADSSASPRWLIVNADDFGASDGVNDGIIDSFDHGIVTSTSLMVTMPATEQAADLAASRPGLSIGIHVDLTGEGSPPPVNIADAHACAAEITRQLERFHSLMGGPPSHVDAHHNIYRLPHLEPLFVAAANEIDRPLREHSSVRYFPDFYGQWDDGESHPEWIATPNLLRMLETEVTLGVTELSCHPGRFDPLFESSYHYDRELELATLIDPAVRHYIDSSDLALINYHQLPAIDAGTKQ